MLGKIVILIFCFVTLVFSQDLKQITESIWKRLGGKEAYQAARQLSFSFVVEREGAVIRERHHVWDRQSGNYVFEQTDKEGAPIQVFININTKTGVAFKNGHQLSGTEGDEQIQQAYAKYINDTYWLLVPVKLSDPGVNLKLDTERSANFDGSVLHLSFENVGLTPGDQYWLYVDQKGSITEWHYLLQSGHTGEHLWQEEVDCGAGLRFSIRKSSKKSNSAIVFKNVRFTKEVEPERFKRPAAEQD